MSELDTTRPVPPPAELGRALHMPGNPHLQNLPPKGAPGYHSQRVRAYIWDHDEYKRVTGYDATAADRAWLEGLKARQRMASAEPTVEDLAERYAGSNPYRRADTDGDVERTIGGRTYTSTAESRAEARARLAEAWDEGKRRWESGQTDRWRTEAGLPPRRHRGAA